MDRSGPMTPRSRNVLLSAIDATDSSRLLDGAEDLKLAINTVLYEANAPITQVFFLSRGVASIIAPVGGGGASK